MGDKEDQNAFLKKARTEGLTEDVMGEPEFVFCDERMYPDGEMDAATLDSEDDIDAIADFMRNADARDYRKVGGIIVLYPVGDLKYADRLLKISHLMNGATHLAVTRETGGSSRVARVFSALAK